MDIGFGHDHVFLLLLRDGHTSFSRDVSESKGSLPHLDKQQSVVEVQHLGVTP
jgi:hypothetical protein